MWGGVPIARDLLVEALLSFYAHAIPQFRGRNELHTLGKIFEMDERRRKTRQEKEGEKTREAKSSYECPRKQNTGMQIDTAGKPCGTYHVHVFSAQLSPSANVEPVFPVMQA